MKNGLLLISVVLGLEAHSMEGLSQLESQLIEKNQALSALKNEIQSKEKLLNSTSSTFYPTLNAVAGWGENRLDNPEERNKGIYGYLDGRMNLFNGFKDRALSNQTEIEVQLKKLDYEAFRREVRLELIETTSAMIYLHKLQVILNAEAKITKEHKEMAAKKVRAGLTSSVDNLEFDLREREIEIQQKEINQLHSESHQKLLHLFGNDISDTELDNLTFSSLQSLKQVEPLSPDNNLEVQRARLLLKQSEFKRQELSGEYLPSVDFYYSFGRITPNEDSPMKNDEFKYGVQISIPLFSGFSTLNTVAAETSETLAKKFRTSQAALDVQSNFNSLKEKIQELMDLYAINELKIVTSKKYFEMTVSEYNRGVKNSPDLVGATERWFSSQKKQFELLKQLELTKTRIEKLN